MESIRGSLANALRRQFFLDVVAKIAPHRGGRREASIDLRRYAAVLEGSTGKFYLQDAAAFVIAGGTQIACTDLFHFHAFPLSPCRNQATTATLPLPVRHPTIPSGVRHVRN